MAERTIESLLEEARSTPPTQSELAYREGCLSPNRIEDLAMQPLLWTDSERDHVAQCRRCARTVAIAMRELPHPNSWAIHRSRLGLASRHEQLQVARHRDGGCVVCRKALTADVGERGLAILVSALCLPLAASGKLESRGVDCRADSADRRLRAIWGIADSQLHLDLRTSDPTLCHRLFGYEFRNSAGIPVEEGFVVLHQLARGRVGVSTQLDGMGLYDRLQPDRLAEPFVAPLELNLLNAEQREKLPRSAAAAVVPLFSGDADVTGRSAAWQSWAAREEVQPGRTDEELALLRRITAAAGGAAL